MPTEEEARAWLKEFKEAKNSLAHFGVLGMKWGQRKQEESAKKDPGLSKGQKVALGAGVGALAVGGAAAAYILSKGKIKATPANLASLRTLNPKKVNLKTVQTTAAKVVQAFEEPTKPMLLTRGKNLGYRFVGNHGLKEPYNLIHAADPGESMAVNTIKRWGKNNEHVVALFHDPAGRTDRAGRIISHQVIVPSSMADDVKSIDDVIAKIWNGKLSKEYDAFWEESLKI